MKIEYTKMPKKENKFRFIIRFYFNVLRTWILFHVKFPWVKYKGFVRIMPGTRFAKRKIRLGNKVQFGRNCSISSDLVVGNNVLIATGVNFIGKYDHTTNISECTIWDSPRGKDEPIIVKNDVWIGQNSTILAGVTINDGAILAACSLLTKDIPACEIWGGIPAKKIKNRFNTEKEKEAHLQFLKTIS